MNAGGQGATRSGSPPSAASPTLPVAWTVSPRDRLDRGMAREEDHEVRVEAPVDPFGVDQPLLDLVKRPVVGRPELADQGLAPAPDPDAGRVLASS